MTKKKSFLIYDNWSTLITSLPDDVAGQLIKAICMYKLGQDPELNDKTVGAIFAMIKEKLDEDTRAYEEVCEKRRKAGAEGGKQKVANASKCYQMGSKSKQDLADNDTDTDIDTHNVIENVNDNDTDNMFKSKEFKDIINLWINYKKSKGWVNNKEKEISEKIIAEKIETHGIDAVRRCIEQSIANGYKGIVWDYIEKKKGSHKRRLYSESEYNQIESELIKKGFDD